MKFKILLPIFLSICVSCGKDDPDPKQTVDSPPQISVTSPSNNSQYTESESVPIKASITDDKEIYEVTVSIKNLSNNTVNTLTSFHVHQTSYSLNLNYDVDSTDNGNYQIIIKVTDLDGNETVKTINVVLNPI